MRSSHLGFYLVDKMGRHVNVGRGFSGLGETASESEAASMVGGLKKTVLIGGIAAAAVWFFFLR